MKIAILGSTGRMGKELLKAVHSEPKATLCGALVRVGNELDGQDIGGFIGTQATGIAFSSEMEKVLGSCDGVIDFTSPEHSIAIAGFCADKKKVHIIGTTGFSPAEEKQLKTYAGKTQIVHSHNFSIGVNLLMHYVEQAASKLSPEDFDIEISEMHHRHKVDAPSGTALSLGKAAAKGRGIPLDTVARYAREGKTGIRPHGEIGFSTLRGGEVIGDHTVLFAGSSERIEFTHKAQDRSIFAKGALHAALWAHGQKAGLYNMIDVLGL